jgi:hypothetical protein
LSFARLRSGLADVFALDLRSLALFRMALGAVILGDLLTRVPVLVALYSDDGAVPRVLALAEQRRVGFPSLYFAWVRLFFGDWNHSKFPHLTRRSLGLGEGSGSGIVWSS